MDQLKPTDSIQQRIQYLFNKLSSSHSAICYRALSEIRTEFIPKPHLLSLFIQAGGLKHIVAQLQKSNKKIVDVSLSILGHCVLEQEPRIIVSIKTLFTSIDPIIFTLSINQQQMISVFLVLLMMIMFYFYLVSQRRRFSRTHKSIAVVRRRNCHFKQKLSCNWFTCSRQTHCSEIRARTLNSPFSRSNNRPFD